MPTILLVRHGQASYGSANYDVLSDLGRAQVDRLVADLQRRGIAAGRVVCGDLARQRDTAAPCAAAAAVDVVIDERFNEYDDGDVLRHHTTSAARLEHHAGDDGPTISSREFQKIVNEGLGGWVAAGASSPCRQPWPDFSAAVTSAVRDLAADLVKGETAIAVSSSGAIAAVAVALLGLAPEALVAFNHVSVNTGITKLVVGRGGISLVSFNEHVHLEGAGGSLITYR